jgi:hypothetical protein
VIDEYLLTGLLSIKNQPIVSQYYNGNTMYKDGMDSIKVSCYVTIFFKQTLQMLVRLAICGSVSMSVYSRYSAQVAKFNKLFTNVYSLNRFQIKK